MRRKSGKLTIEDYIHFCENPKETDLTINCLNQIIEMHGAAKLHQSPKKVIIDALSSIDLMVLFRSTLKENISSSAFLTLEKVTEDLSTLQWNECSIQSIENVGSRKEKLSNENELQNICVSSTVCENANKSKSKRKRKSTKKVGMVVAAPAITPSTSSISYGSF